jgi:prepilin-type N-terminal cleavage/methylation domain-containing protein
MRHKKRNEQGFSLLETLVVIGIMAILASITIFKSFGTMESYQANAGMDIVRSQLRVARQVAISQRRNVKVSFNVAATPPTITYQVQAGNYAGSNEVNGTPAVMPLPNQVQFITEGTPDTPMAFGTCSGISGAICIGPPNNPVSGGPAIMGFNTEGQFTDSTYVNTLNGTILIGIPNQIATARAVTILGGTGRVRSYSYIGGTGTSQWTE